MTIEDWRAAKKLVSVVGPSDNRKAEGTEYAVAEGTEVCWLYPGLFVIEIHEGRFLLQLPMEQEISGDLEWLEERLWEYARLELTAEPASGRKFGFLCDARELELLINGLEVLAPDSSIDNAARAELLERLRGMLP
jgi:hypothetical protein